MYKMAGGLALLNNPKITLNLKSDTQTQIRQYSNKSNYQKANHNILVSTIYASNQKKPWSTLCVLSTTYTGSKDDKGILPRQVDTVRRVQNLWIATNFP
jgi:hypothetical protein